MSLLFCRCYVQYILLTHISQWRVTSNYWIYRFVHHLHLKCLTMLMKIRAHLLIKLEMLLQEIPFITATHGKTFTYQISMSYAIHLFCYFVMYWFPTLHGFLFTSFEACWILAWKAASPGTLRLQIRCKQDITIIYVMIYTWSCLHVEPTNIIGPCDILYLCSFVSISGIRCTILNYKNLTVFIENLYKPCELWSIEQ